MLHNNIAPRFLPTAPGLTLSHPVRELDPPLSISHGRTGSRSGWFICYICKRKSWLCRGCPVTCCPAFPRQLVPLIHQFTLIGWRPSSGPARSSAKRPTCPADVRTPRSIFIKGSRVAGLPDWGAVLFTSKAAEIRARTRELTLHTLGWRCIPNEPCRHSPI